MKPADLTGKKFGLLTALYRNGKNKEGRYMWRCKCECGNEYDVAASSLTSGNTRSCGCLQPKRARETHFKHGDSPYGKKATKLYIVWGGMKKQMHLQKSRRVQKLRSTRNICVLRVGVRLCNVQRLGVEKRIQGRIAIRSNRQRQRLFA